MIIVIPLFRLDDKKVKNCCENCYKRMAIRSISHLDGMLGEMDFIISRFTVILVKMQKSDAKKNESVILRIYYIKRVIQRVILRTGKMF